ncbi:MAG: hypothetical protein RDV48_07620 [Candidatus Eremiobacteraeota bacterium]|nr:hypothetical protein [Candidatus Eremiobacteraeota bacterium]
MMKRSLCLLLLLALALILPGCGGGGGGGSAAGGYYSSYSPQASPTVTPTPPVWSGTSKFGCGGPESSDFQSLVALGVHRKRVAISIFPSGSFTFDFLDSQVTANQAYSILTYFIIDPNRTGSTWVSSSTFSSALGTIVERYDGDGVNDMPGLLYPLQDFEICNEIDTQSTRWSGFTDAMYLDFMEKCFAAVKSASPGARLFAGALSQPPVGNNNKTFDRLVQNGGTPYFDAISYHDYQYLLEMDSLQAYLASRNLLSKPVYITEADMSVEYNTSPQPTFTEQANMLIKSYAYALANSNIKTIIVTELQALSTQPAKLQWAALLDLSGTKRPSFYACGKLIEKVDNFTESGLFSAGTGITCVRFVANNRTVYILWAAAAAQAMIPTSAPRVRVTPVVPDGNGQFTSTEITASAGYATVPASSTASYVEEVVP